MICVGIDIGSITTKAAVVRDGRLLSSAIIPTGYMAERAGRRVYQQVLDQAGIDAGAVDRIVATGYGRKLVDFAHRSLTEITCHAAGAHFQNPAIRSVVDIGGQDSKAIALDGKGGVRDFAMNDKCAAGTGRFLEVMATALELELDAFGRLSLESDRPAVISSLCTVFAESEVISLIAKGERRENIIAGIHNAIAARVAAMANRIGLSAPVMMTGGVAKNRGVVKALAQRLGHELEISALAQVNGALGAALMATHGR